MPSVVSSILEERGLLAFLEARSTFNGAWSEHKAVSDAEIEHRSSFGQRRPK